MAIKTTNGFFNWLKSKFYLKTEIDSQLAGKASTSVATTSANGLMSSTDKSKLDGIATGANKTTVDSSLSSSSANPVQNKVVTQGLNGKSDSDHTHTVSDVTNLGVASTSGNGLMSSAMVTKLNGIATGANKTTVDSALSSTSTNPVQNKVVNAQLTSLNNNKANIGHTHGEAYSATTLKSNTFCQVLGNIAIVSWWGGTVNISKTGDWVDLWTLPVTNKGKAVWTGNVHNSANGLLYFKVEAGSNKVQAFSTNATGNLPHFPGHLVFFID